MLAQMEELERANYLQRKQEEEELKRQKLEEEKYGIYNRLAPDCPAHFDNLIALNIIIFNNIVGLQAYVELQYCRCTSGILAMYRVLASK